MRITKDVTVSGGYHANAWVVLRVKGGKLSKWQRYRLENKMCGIRGCLCGPQHGWEVEGMPRDAFFETLYEANDLI